METKYIPQNAKDDHRAFFKGLLERLLGPRKPVPLFHYTTGNALIEIIKTGTLWATHVGCLSDAKEILHAVDLLRETAERCLAKPDTSQEYGQLLHKIIAILRQPNVEISPVFVTCFSEKPDDLSQWRAYGGIEGGYAIEFDHQALRLGCQKLGVWLVPVEYRPDEQAAIMASILVETEAFFNQGLSNNWAPSLTEWVDEFSEYWLWNLSFLAPVFKDPAFADEAEWRTIHWFRPENVPNLRFIQRRLMLTRHLPLTFSEANANGYTPLPLSSVMVGPSVHARLSQVGVGDLLKALGYDQSVQINLTKVPYRTMN